MKHEVNADEAGTPSKKRRSSNQFRDFEDDDSDNATLWTKSQPTVSYAFLPAKQLRMMAVEY
jgi:hypothetical protein